METKRREVANSNNIMKLYIKQLRPVLGNREKNLEMMIEAIDEAIKLEKEIVIFPELALTGNSIEDIAYDVAIKKVPSSLLEKSKNIDIIFGAIELGEDEFLYNTAYYLTNGEVAGKHRKIYLADYNGSTESRIFASGEKLETIDTKFGKVGILMSEDFHHQSTQYILSQAGIKYLFVLSNEVAVLNENGIGKEMETLAKANSLLNGIFTIFVNRIGIEDGKHFYGNSFVVDPNGKIIEKVEAFKDLALDCQLDRSEIRRARIRRPLLKNENIRLVVSELKKVVTDKRG